MSRKMSRIYLIMLVLFHLNSFGQSSKRSDYFLIYDQKQHHLKDGKTYPFDRPFSLLIPGMTGKQTVDIRIYESFTKGENWYRTETEYTDCDGKKVRQAIMDKELNFAKNSDTLMINIDPLRPNKQFDILIRYALLDSSKRLLLKANELIATSNVDAEAGYNAFRNSTFDKIDKIGVLDWKIDDYLKFFYYPRLDTHYKKLLADRSTSSSDSLSQNDLESLIALSTEDTPLFGKTSLLIPVILNKRMRDVFLGVQNVFKVHENNDNTDMLDFKLRAANLQSNVQFFDSLSTSVDAILMKEGNTPVINGSTIDLFKLRMITQALHDTLSSNLKRFTSEVKMINKEISAEPKLISMIVLSGNTASNDLKTAGGNVLFLDAGLTNIFARDLHSRIISIPRLYWGVSIYFRPIDKNTRTNSFYKKKELPINKGCKRDSDGNYIYGPDYEVITKRDIRQRLSLNIGFTLGGIQKAEFDNLYNNMSLLIGPAYRFARAFKFSAGMALVKRTSFNPVFSEKKIIAGTYASVSVDIDFIQGLKDITTLLFK